MNEPESSAKLLKNTAKKYEFFYKYFLSDNKNKTELLVRQSQNVKTTT